MITMPGEQSCDGHPPPDGIAALLRLAVVSVDADGSVSYWNRGAEELFGHRWEAVFGHRARGLLPAPADPPLTGERDAIALLDGLTRPRWCGAFPVTDHAGALRDTLWWSYRITERTGRGLLVLAAHAKPLRAGALRLAIGDRMLPYVLAETAGPDGVELTARFTPAPSPATAARTAVRLAAVLPRVSPGRLDRITRQIAQLGAPALQVEGCAPLAVLPYEAGPPPRTARRGEPAVPARRRAELPAAPRHRTRKRPPLIPVPPPGFPPPAPGGLLDQQLALLRETGARVGTTLEPGTTAAELCAVAVPRFADFASVLVVDQLFSDALRDGSVPGRQAHQVDGGQAVTVRRLAVSGGCTSKAWGSVVPEGELFTLPGGQVPGLAEPLLLPVVDPALAEDVAADLGAPALGDLLANRSVLVTPLTARGLVLGQMRFVRDPDRRPFDAADAATAVEFAARGAVHLDNARLHRLESRAAATLQRSMLPTSPPRIPGVRIAHHYRPGDRQAQVGGDWFDAIQLPGGRVALVVGDVMGHGLLSAAVMGQFRTAVQTMAALDLPPAQLLRHLDNLAHRLGTTDHLATCVYAVYDPIHRTLALANAGHIPPVLARHDGRSELLKIPEGAPIGVGGVPFETVEIPVPDGSWLVLCTDGLVEVRGEGIDAGLAALCANVIEPQQTPEDVCNQILSQVHYEERGDDVALLVARFEGIAPQDVAERRLRLDHSEVRAARAFSRKQLADWGLGQLGDLTELLVSELVTNALRVATHEVQLRLMRVGKLLVEVSDDDHNLPQLRRADEDDEDGRGLALVSNLSHRWGTSRQAVGKVVWFELRLPQD
ncbi:ATP-binding SpoIIE family protein phosphatase [Streptantibioticus ferralitis]|uniref:SpoIIE family protein phosphatase n=1 Tax=Streptantibioticus ferralitis TaxID=236510 RepID=A0ABT5ZAC7_9ACTN|nr:SpoIIE family protein phosphatase [Streptantibioticus ferralitis]MDF2260779.1 SpoIIE family protein phosphatase [Streptantibioticus ferralitis]